MQDFKELVYHCQLEDMQCNGCFYTWTNKQEGGDAISSKLDRTLVNNEWCNTWPEVHTEFMICGVSDHSPMIIHWTNITIRREHSFKFLNHLTLDSEFINTVNSNWKQDGEEFAMFRLMRNLDNIRPGLRDLNNRKYRDIDMREIQARKRLDTIQDMLQLDPLNNHLQKMEMEARKEHSEERKKRAVTCSLIVHGVVSY
ncbi:hypothetical protein RIF29_00488 [Crotalaria pallida]|uniref:Endonuclease/exonuclease/phosphatase domain-containing protein n=1 Tax=Crotalaria pallida TaxID=3830 RepID=A0AAN9P719_CROPI